MRSNSKNFLKVTAILAAATIGDGIFALPYIFYRSGWFLGLFYLAFLTTVVIVAHVVYLKVLEEVGEKERLLGLAKRYFGKWGFGVGFFTIVVGLLLALVAILILGARFITLLFPAVPMLSALIVFWILTAIPLLLHDRRVVGLELLGIVSTSAIIVFVFAVAWPHVSFGAAPAMHAADAFLPFGVIVFALAGWTGIEPAYEIRKREGVRGSLVLPVAAGTIFASLLYLLFIMGILGSATTIAPDTLSGLLNWPTWERIVLTVLGFLAVWTIYMPISREIKNSLDRDLGWEPFMTKLLILFTPLIFVLSGFNNFLLVVGFVGGLFLSLQYFLIMAVGHKALVLSAWKKFLMDIVALVFILAAVYEVYYFVIG